MKCASLISGSKANCFYIESRHEAFLIDAGLSFPKLEKTISELAINPDKLKGILVTHEHEDHVKHLKRVSSALKLPIYLTEETMKKTGISSQYTNIIKAGDQLSFDTIDVQTFQVLHDSEMCLGFVFTSENKKIFYVSDIGSFDDNILSYAENADFIGIEANYEPIMLEQCAYPKYLKDRISGGAGHLSNPEAVSFVKNTASTKTKNVMFLHISENSNCITHVEKMIDQDLYHHFPEIHYRISNRYGYSPLIEV